MELNIVKREYESEFLARCASGFENALVKELIGIGCMRVKPIKGGALFMGTFADGLRVCLWSRIATRVLMEIMRTSAHSADTLYAGVRKVAWERIISSNASIAMHATGQNSALRNTQFTALKVKDAVCDRLVAERGERPDVNGTDPDFPVEVVIYRDRATIYLNLSGPAQHRRGYRENGVQTGAPLKETLAASMLLAAGWNEMVADGVGFADPMCGSGTLPIEAALIAANVAPGLLRTRWGFESYLRFDPSQWGFLLKEASEACISKGEMNVRILGGDKDATAIDIARANADRAGVGDMIEFFVDDAANLSKHMKRGRKLHGGLVACNPPYGYRLNSGENLSRIYSALSAATAGLHGDWRLETISPDLGIDTGLGRMPYQTIPCNNGPLSTSLRIYDMDIAPNSISITSLSGTDIFVPVAEQGSRQFASRLRKVAKERAKWARKAGVQSYRVYDADLPEYAFSIDLYRKAGDNSLLARVEEHRAGTGVERERADHRFFDGLAIIPAVLDISHEQVFFKRSSYEKGTPSSPDCWTNVREAEFVFEVNLGSQRECGLALDMRPVRELLRAEALGKRFACVLAHAGAPTVYAAAGGAASTVTVDPSKVFLEQAQRVMKENGFGERNHTFACMDALEWMATQVKTKRLYDLVFCDLSAFPSSKDDAGNNRPKDGDSQIYRSLLTGIAKILAPGGKLLLTCRNCKPEPLEKVFAELGLKGRDVTPETIGHDFSRTPSIHRAFLVVFDDALKQDVHNR